MASLDGGLRLRSNIHENEEIELIPPPLFSTQMLILVKRERVVSEFLGFKKNLKPFITY